MKIKLSYNQLREYLEAPAPDFPKYVAPLLNLANQCAQGTRPAVVGQMSELVQSFPGRTLEEWRRWYLGRHPEAIRAATDRIVEMLEKLRHAMDNISPEIVERWVEDLVIFKTFIGMRFQEAVLKEVAALRGTHYRLAEPDEEARGIDGFVGGQPVAIKPATYKSKPSLRDALEGEVIFYTKKRDGIEIELGP